jgi:hypothetical protein
MVFGSPMLLSAGRFMSILAVRLIIGARGDGRGGLPGTRLLAPRAVAQGDWRDGAAGSWLGAQWREVTPAAARLPGSACGGSASAKGSARDLQNLLNPLVLRKIL